MGRLCADAAAGRSSVNLYTQNAMPLEVFMVEDNLMLVMRGVLEDHLAAHTLLLARDGKQAPELIARIGKPDGLPCPDIMLLDLNMPGADGCEILAAFRQCERCRHVPVVVVSSEVRPKSLPALREFGVSHYFQKPLEFNEYLKLGKLVADIVAREGS